MKAFLRYFFFGSLAAFVVTIPILSYMLFTNTASENAGAKETRNLGTVDYAKLPMPQDAEEISRDKSNEGERITLEVAQSMENVRRFYENVLVLHGWIKEDEAEANGDITQEYVLERKKLLISITSGEEENSSIVSIELIST